MKLLQTGHIQELESELTSMHDISVDQLPLLYCQPSTTASQLILIRLQL